MGRYGLTIQSKRTTIRVGVATTESAKHGCQWCARCEGDREACVTVGVAAGVEGRGKGGSGVKTFLALCMVVAVGVMAARGQTNAVGKLNIRGGVYEGEIKNSKANGQGTWTHPAGYKYVGEIKDGDRTGQGTMTWPSGDTYVGAWKDDLRNGQGTFTKPDGTKYVGEWKAGEPNGRGTLTQENGTKTSGLWKNGEYIGTETNAPQTASSGCEKKP